MGYGRPQANFYFWGALSPQQALQGPAGVDPKVDGERLAGRKRLGAPRIMAVDIARVRSGIGIKLTPSSLFGKKLSNSARFLQIPGARVAVQPATVIARSEATKQSMPPRPAAWIASPSARNDGGEFGSLILLSVLTGAAAWANPTEIKRQFGGAVDFIGDNRVIFDLGGAKYRIVVHVSYTYGRILVKFIGTHAEYDRIDPETVSWRTR